MQPNQIGGGYMFYPRVVQQQTGGRSGEQQSGGANPSRLIYNTNNLNYLPPKDDFNKSGSCARFLSAFSHLPCLPSSMSRLTKGIIGFIIFLIFLSVVIIALGLIPLYLQLAENNSPKSSFSIDVKNGLNLQNQPLSSILTTSDSNRTAEQNATLFSGITTLSDQLNDKIKLKLDQNIEKFFNVRLAPNQQGTIDVSFTIKTKPITRSDLNTFKSNIPSLMRSSNAFGDIKLPNSTLFVSPNAEFAEPVEGEISVKPLQLSQTATSSAQLSGQIASLGLEDSGNGVESSLEADLKNPQASRPGQQQKRPSNNKNNRGDGKNQHEHDDGEIDQAAIAQSSNIKLLPNYFPPNYLPPPPQIPPPPIYNNQPGAYQQQPNNNAYQQPSSNSAYQATNNKNNGAYQGNGNNGYQSNNGYQAPSNNYQQPSNGYQPQSNNNGYQPVSNGYQQNNQYLPPPPPPPQYQPYNGNNYNNNNGYNDEKKEYYEEEKKEDKKEDKEDIFKKIKKLKDEGEEKRKKDMEEEKAKIEKMLHEDKIEKEKEKERKMLEKEEEKIKEIKRKLEELNEEKMKSNYGKLKSSAHQPEQIALKLSSSQAEVEKKSDVAVELVGKSNPEAASTEKKTETLKEAVKNN